MKTKDQYYPMFDTTPLGKIGYRKNVNIFIEPSHELSPRDHNYKNTVRIRLQWDEQKYGGEANIRIGFRDALSLVHQIVDELNDVYPVELVKEALLQLSLQQGALFMATHPELLKKDGE